MKIRSVDLFCGVGGLTYGVRTAGIDVLAGYDIDSASQYAYETNNPGTRFINKDVADISEGEIAQIFPADTDIRVLMGCAPCQPFSTYNRLPADSPARSSKMELLDHFGFQVKNALPDIVSMENVPNLSKEPVFTRFVQLLDNLDYHVDWKIVNAAEYGVPQSRKRLLLLASRLGSISLIQPSHDKSRFVTVRDKIGNLPAIRAGETDPSDNLHRSRGLTDINLSRIKASQPGGTWDDWPEDLLPDAYRRPSGRTYKSVYGRLEWDKLSSTITTQFIGYGSGRFGHPEQDRALSLREGALLQTFPRSYSFIPDDAGTDYNVQPIAIQIGNAVPPRLGEVIGQSIMSHINDAML
ncbi:DNA cytosine methyltransferase [Trueperella pyogenes]|uniref:DNA cytosine methyltransferase n=1 Tax=Trueperella pyogenes TaxID=1661 RepID=UPI00345CE59B